MYKLAIIFKSYLNSFSKKKVQYNLSQIVNLSYDVVIFSFTNDEEYLTKKFAKIHTPFNYFQ